MKNKFVVLTGADGDIGLAISRVVYRKGFSLIAITRSNKRATLLRSIFEKKPECLHIYNIELSCADEIAVVTKIINLEFRSIYALINNAGVYPIIKLANYNLDNWNMVMAVNLTAPFLFCTLLMDCIEPGGRIINISSAAAHLGSRDIAYSASKSGLIGLSKSLARGLGPKQIMVNVVAPGTIFTKMSKKMPSEAININKKNSILNRIGLPKEVAAAVSFLLDDDNTYMTGSTIDINGGLYLR